MQLHLVGGFLGSGKTTAIIAAARRLMAKGQKVGVVTNDQGKYLVDTSFFQSQHIPTVEVTSGCFCCNFENFAEKLEQLKASEQPDVIFAESVGSCSDIVATVIRPLLELAESKTPATSFSVFVDSQLLLAFLQGEELPFSENVIYIFQKQIEEGRVLVINKIDLLTDEEAWQVKALAARAYPDKTICLQNSKSAADVAAWYRLIGEESGLAGIRPVEVDYARYGEGEAELAWLDQEVTVEVPGGNAFPAATAMICEVSRRLAARRAPIGHLKFMLASDRDEIKISIPTIAQPGWEHELEGKEGARVSVLINARVQMEPGALRELVAGALDTAASTPGVTVRPGEAQFFKPGFPHPTHRMLD